MSTPPPLPSEGPPPLPTPTPGLPPVDKEPTLSKAPPKGKLFPCLNCGAKVEFDPRERALKCPYCGHTTAVEGNGGAVEERDFNEYASKLVKGRAGGIAGRSTQVKCSGCGATVLLEDKVVTDECPFCGTHLKNEPEAVEGMIPPESLIPFRLDLRAARGAFEKWLSGLWFAPSALKNLANLGQLTGVYVPYWTYDAMTYTKYTGMRGDDYQETEYYTERDANGNEVQKSRTVTRTNWYPVSGEVQHFFDDVLVCGSKTIKEHLIDGMAPWETGELEPFQDAFLAGLKTERYAVDLKQGLRVAKEKMQPVIEQLIREDIGGDHQRITGTDTRYLGVTFKHCLLPVWVAHYRFSDKLFHILINGRTGKVSGERPYSFWKIFGLVAIIVLVIGLIIGAVMTFSNNKGGGPAKGRRADAGRVAPAPHAADPVAALANRPLPRSGRRNGGPNRDADGRGARGRRQGLPLRRAGGRRRRTRRAGGDRAGHAPGRSGEGAHAGLRDPQ
jgi:DNA-directed RNA polymerase subunit RPC12/RpoP